MVKDSIRRHGQRKCSATPGGEFKMYIKLIRSLAYSDTYYREVNVPAVQVGDYVRPIWMDVFAEDDAAIDDLRVGWDFNARDTFNVVSGKYLRLRGCVFKITDHHYHIFFPSEHREIYILNLHTANFVCEGPRIREVWIRFHVKPNPSERVQPFTVPWNSLEYDVVEVVRGVVRLQLLARCTHVLLSEAPIAAYRVEDDITPFDQVVTTRATLPCVRINDLYCIQINKDAPPWPSLEETEDMWLMRPYIWIQVPETTTTLTYWASSANELHGFEGMYASRYLTHHRFKLPVFIAERHRIR